MVLHSTEFKKVTIFGATGKVGSRSCRSALERGHEVTAFVRDPSRLPDDVRPRVRIVVGDVNNKDDVMRALKGANAVVYAVGMPHDSSVVENKRVTTMGLKLVLECMQQLLIERISVCLATFLLWDPSKLPSWAIPHTEDHKESWAMLKAQDSNIKWTGVLPPRFMEWPNSGGKYVVKHDIPVGRHISMDDLGEFMVDCLGIETHFNKSCVIANTTEYLDEKQYAASH